MKTHIRSILSTLLLVAFVLLLVGLIAPGRAAVLTYTAPAPQTGDSALVIANKVAVAQAKGNAFSNIITSTTTTVKSGEGVLDRIVINTAGAGSTFTIYDNTAASGTKIATGTGAAQTTLLYNVRFATGLTIVTASGTPADITVSYR